MIAAGDVIFGSYDPISMLRDTTGTITVTCWGRKNARVTYKIGLTTGYSGSFNPREMGSSSYTLSYNLYTDSSRSMIWGDGRNGTSTVGATVKLTDWVTTYCHTVYGRIPAAQPTAGAGNYIDFPLIAWLEYN